MTIISRFILIIFIAFLTACGHTAPEAGMTKVENTVVPFAWTAVALTQTAMPTATLPSPTFTPTPTPLPKFPLDGYVMLFTKDGDLYFQDGENTPVKLTHVGEKSYYSRLSDDNQKAVFSRSDGNTYSINSNGSQEQVILTKGWVFSQKEGTSINVGDFVPGTHQVFFETYLCESYKRDSPCSASLFLTDADTGNIKKLTDLGNGNFKISPNGKMIAIGTVGRMEILDMDGKLIRQKVLAYEPNERARNPSPRLFWLPDSSGLIMAFPDKIYTSRAWGDIPAYTVWRYTIDNNNTMLIPLEPPLMGLDHFFDISPDGNWSLYGGISNADTETSLYIGNLTNGRVQNFGNDVQPTFSWSPDSKYFIYTSTQSTLGTINNPSVFVKTCYLYKWVDASHFMCIPYEENAQRIRLAEIDSGAIRIYDLGLDKDSEPFVLIKSK